MMTSRAEYRLLLRHDNADTRLMPKGYEAGLVSEERYQRFLKKQEAVQAEIDRLSATIMPPSQAVNDFLKEQNSTPIKNGVSLKELLRRPEITYEALEAIDKGRKDVTLNKTAREEVEILVKYEGYIKRQEQQVEQFKKMEKMLIPDDVDFKAIPTISLEAREKLSKLRPASVGQAGRISGVSPADVTALVVYLKTRQD
jgi:tRNA uridine 5-carboxymethylaminomethyl modification enzyme